MLSFRTSALLAVVAALTVVAAAWGASGSSREAAGAPAVANGGDAPPIIPSIVDTRLTRGESALSRATADVDQGQAAQAVVPVNAALSNLTNGWGAEKYVIKTAPPPPAEDAYPDGTGAGGPAYAGPEDTGFALLSAQHDLVTTAVSLADTSNTALQNGLINAINKTQSLRVTEIKYIHTIAPPPVGDGPGAGSTWALVMPGYAAVLSDEIQEIKGRLAMAKFSAPVKTALTNARLKASDTLDLVNKYWPPVPAD
jgi:hypothetical protein